MTRHHRLPALLLTLTAVSPAAALPPDADTFVQQRLIGEKVWGDRPELFIKSDNPAGANDRAGVVRFTLPAGAEASGAALRFTRSPTKPENEPDPLPAIELYGVADGADELTFDDATWKSGGAEAAVDKSGNRIREGFIHDADDAAAGAQPLAVATPTGGELVFRGDALDAYLTGRAGGSAAFVLIAQRGEGKGGTKPLQLHSREAAGPDALKPTLVLDGVLAALPADAAGGDAEPPKNGAVVGTRVHFEPSGGGEIKLDAVIGNGIRYSFYDQDGRRYNLPTMGGVDDPTLSSEQARAGSHSLRIHCGPTEGDGRDRLEFRLKAGSTDEEPLTFGQDRWYGWSLYIDPASQPAPAGKYLHVTQLWQPSTVGRMAKRAKWGIPGAGSFLPGRDGFELDLVLKSDGAREQFSLGDLEPGQWHDIVFHVLLSHSKDDKRGYFQAWVNGEPVANEFVEIGNFPRDADGFVAKDTMDIRMGLYRKNQQATQTFFLDEIWYDDRPVDASMAELAIGGGVDGESQLKDAAAQDDAGPPAEPA